LTAWVALAAQKLLANAAAFTRLTTDVQQGRARLEEGLVAVWDKFFAAWFRVACMGSGSSSREAWAMVPLTDWLHPSFLQLADKVLQRPMGSVKPMMVMHALMAGVSVGAGNPMAHPRLAAAAGLKPDPALGAQVAAAVQQVGAHAMATFAMSGSS
jgi:hypothetical protein